MGVYAAMSVAGAAAGLLAGGLLVTYASWRWVLFVNVPIGVAVALAAPAVLPRAPGGPGRLDLPGAITATGAVAALVYGLSNAATSPDGTSHWGDGKVVAALTAGAVLLAAFAVIETRSRHALLPVRLLRSRDRLGANLIMLAVGTAMFGVFFFLVLFVQDVSGYSALRTGVAFLPLTVAMLAASGASTALVSRIGPRPLLLAGGAAIGGGLYWLSRMTEHGTYAGGVLGPSLLAGAGFGLLVVPLQLTALGGVAGADSGVAASLLNVGRQVGGCVGLAVLGTVAWTVVAAAPASRPPRRPGRPRPPRGRSRPTGTPWWPGFDRAFLVAAAISVLILAATITMIRSRPVPSRESSVSAVTAP